MRPLVIIIRPVVPVVVGTREWTVCSYRGRGLRRSLSRGTFDLQRPQIPRDTKEKIPLNEKVRDCGLM